MDFLNDFITKAKLREQVNAFKKQYAQMGGWKKFSSGEWLLELARASFKAYYEKANHVYFTNKYPGKDRDFIIGKLTSVAARNALLLGGITGTLMSADELVAVATAGEAGIGLPANIAIAGASIASDAIGLVSIQLQLVANIAALYNCPLDPEDPEDILTILGYAVGGAVAEAAGNASMKIGMNLAKSGVRQVLKGETLKAVQKIAAKAGIKILQKTVAKLAAPIVSIALGAGWNYAAIRATSKIACAGMAKRNQENYKPTVNPGLLRRLNEYKARKAEKAAKEAVQATSQTSEI